MKNLLCIAIALVMVSCQPFDGIFDYTGGYSHDDKGHSGDDSGGEEQEPQIAVPDTTIWITAVSFPDGYDWRKDSSYYLAEGELSLYRNFEKTLAVGTGRKNHVSTASDMHFVMNGDLYTQYNAGGHTFIGKNGSIVLEYDSAELIKGLLTLDGSLFTLGSDRNGHGFSLRRDGNVVFSDSEGQIWGDFNDSSFSPSGALYPVDSSGRFCWYRISGQKAEWYTAGTNGKSEIYDLPEGFSSILDLRDSENGELCAAVKADGSLYFISENKSSSISQGRTTSGRNCRIFNGGGAVAMYDADKGPCSVWSGDMMILLASGGVDYMLSDGENFAGVKRSADGSVSFSGKAGRMKSIQGQYYLFNRHCVCLCGGVLYMVLTPLDNGAKPLLWVDGRIRELDIDGFLSGVYVELSLPN